ncbi:MAG: AAA family ATPase [Terrimicrobiaceae bacterium]|nr:AAA family ATPase [Terrimicrobiaceae bacterium]
MNNSETHHHMISSFTISNFKAFGPAQTIPLKPITLIFGPNSAGKSSILHSLLFAHESLRTGNLDVRQTELGGQSVDLGGFQQLTHRCNPDNTVTLAFHLPKLSGEKSLGWELENIVIRATLQMQKSMLSSGDKALDELLGEPGVHFVDQSSADTVRILERFLADRISGEGATPILRRFEVEVGGEVLVQASRRAERGMKIDRFATHHPTCRQFIEAIVLANSTTQNFDEADADVVAKALDEMLPEIELDEYGFLARSKRRTLADLALKTDFAPIEKERRAETLRGHARQFLPRLINGLFDLVSGALENFFEKLDYLGPLRSYPPRHLSLDAITDSGKSEGMDAWRTVLRDAKIRDKINRWLSSEFLTTRYELGVNSLVPLHLAAEALETEFSDIVNERAAQHDEDRENSGTPESDERFYAPYSCGQWDTPELFRRMLWQIIQRSSRSAVPELTLMDKRTGTFVSHRDIGIGVSQLLPVLVKAYAKQGSVVAIEQPEIHLHPALQAELADVFIESALGDQKNTFLLETHSEHILLRLMKRMRQTHEQSLPKGTCPITPNDVSLLFVSPGPEGSVVQDIGLNERGELVKAWPGGFFEEGLNEIFD